MQNSKDTQPIQSFDDENILADALYSQKFITQQYNTFAGECVTTIIRDDLVSLLNEEHQIQAEIFEELQKRGLYNVEATSPQQLAQVKEKFSEQ